MSNSVDAKLKELGIELPTPPKPAAAYVPAVQSGNLVFISGQIPMVNGELQYVGKVGADLGLEDAQACARVCAINILANIKVACGGDLSRVTRVVKLGGFVNCTPDFNEIPQVINGASNLIGEVFGDKGEHTRFAVGAVNLPFGVAVEVEAIVEIS